MKTERCFDQSVILHVHTPTSTNTQPPFCFCVQLVTLYLVKWCSLPYEDSTWELKADIDQSKIEEYERIATHMPSTNRVASICVYENICQLQWVPSSSPCRHVCVCWSATFSFLPPDFNSLTALHRATFLWSHTPWTCGRPNHYECV